MQIFPDIEEGRLSIIQTFADKRSVGVIFRQNLSVDVICGRSLMTKYAISNCPQPPGRGGGGKNNK